MQELPPLDCHWRRVRRARCWLSPDADAAREADKISAAAAANAFLKSLPQDLRTRPAFPSTPRNASPGTTSPRSASAYRCSSSTTRRANCSAAARHGPVARRAARRARRHEAREHPAPRGDRGRRGQCVATRSRPVLHRRLRQTVGYRALGLALRRSPSVDQRHPTAGRAARRSAPLFIGANPARVLSGPMPAFDCWPPKKIWGAS